MDTHHSLHIIYPFLLILPLMDDFEESSQNTDPSTQNEMLAEVVLLTSSLGGLKKQLFESARAQHLLDCKGLVYYIVDANKDLSNATDWKDYELFENWKSEGILRLFKDDSGNDSDYIVARLICPNCLCDKETEEVSCPKCKIEYKNIVPEEYDDNTYIRKLCQGLPCQ
eukprot:XP_763424.1 hypothetical protein [Theileria parva strain Muguga]